MRPRANDRPMTAKLNFILLEGFMSFDELMVHLIVSCNRNLEDSRTARRQEWSAKHEYVNNQLTRSDPYQTPSDLMLDLPASDASNKDKIGDLRHRLGSFYPYRELSFDVKSVRIDYLLPLQYQINLEHIAELSKTIRPRMAEPALLDLCIDLRGEADPSLMRQQFRTSQEGAGSAIFTSESEDLRLRAVECRDVYVHEREGRPLAETRAKAVVLMFGRGDPFVSAFSTYRMVAGPDGRAVKRPLIILNNGLHRAFALKRAGYTHMPCVVADLTPATEASYLMNWGPRLGYLNLNRPPLVKDFLNSGLTSLISAPAKRSMLRLNWSSELLQIFD